MDRTIARFKKDMAGEISSYSKTSVKKSAIPPDPKAAVTRDLGYTLIDAIDGFVLIDPSKGDTTFTATSKGPKLGIQSAIVQSVGTNYDTSGTVKEQLIHFIVGAYGPNPSVSFPLDGAPHTLNISLPNSTAAIGASFKVQSSGYPFYIKFQTYSMTQCVSGRIYNNLRDFLQPPAKPAVGCPDNPWSKEYGGQTYAFAGYTGAPSILYVLIITASEQKLIRSIFHVVTGYPDGELISGTSATDSNGLLRLRLSAAEIQRGGSIIVTNLETTEPLKFFFVSGERI